MLWSALSVSAQPLLPSMLALSLTSSVPIVCPGASVLRGKDIKEPSHLAGQGCHSVGSAGWTSAAPRLARLENSKFKSHLFIQSLVKRHRYAERMQEEVEKLREKRRGLGIGQEVPGTTNQTIGVEEEEEDTVLEHKTIKKAKVGEDFPRRCGQ